MTYYDTLDKKKYDELGRSFSLFKPYSLEKDQIAHSDIVADEIMSNYGTRTIVDDKDITFKSLLDGTKRIFGVDGIGFVYLGSTVESILSNAKYSKGLSLYDYDFTVMSDIAFNGQSYLKVPNRIILPDYFTLSSVHFLAHETCHILKELNPLECKGLYSDEEVIPITLELISAFEDRNFDVFKRREYLMRDTADLYKKLSSDKRYITSEDKVGFVSCYRKCIMYLNSFYYAMKLFSRYLEDKENTLEYIEMVLIGQSTTRRLVDVLFTEDDIAYDIGLSEFRSKLK